MVTNKIQSFIEIIRPYNMVGGILLFNVGFFIFTGNYKIDINYFVGILVIILIFAFATIQNDIEDLEIDKINSPNKVITSGRLDIKQISNLNSIILLILLSLSLYNFPNHLFFILSMLLIAWIYNSKPFLLSRKPFASLIILALSYSTIPLLYGYYLNLGLKINNYFIYLIIFWFLIRISVSILKDYKDEVGDKIYSKKTFYLVFGNKRTALVSVLFFCLGSLGIIYILFMIRGVSFLFILPIIFFFKNLYLRLQLFKTSEVKKLTYIFHKIFFGQNQFDLMLLLCLIFLK